MKEDYSKTNLTAENERLRKELSQLLIEKATANEVYSETVARYELELTRLQQKQQDCSANESPVDSTTTHHNETTTSSEETPLEKRKGGISGGGSNLISAASYFMSSWISPSAAVAHVRERGRSRGRKQIAKYRSSPVETFDSSSDIKLTTTDIATAEQTAVNNGEPAVNNPFSIKDSEKKVDTTSVHLPFIGSISSQKLKRDDSKSLREQVVSNWESSILNDELYREDSGYILSTGRRRASGHHRPFWKSLMSIRPPMVTKSISVSGGTNATTTHQTHSNNELLEAWDRIFCGWDRFRNSKQFYRLLKEGVPYQARGTLWQKAIGDRLLITPALYQATVHRVRIFRRYLIRTSLRYRTRLEETFGSAILENDFNVSTTTTTTTELPGSSDSYKQNQKSLPTTTAILHNQYNKPSNHDACKNDRLSEPDSTTPSCQLCDGLWLPSVISSFETISADLRRTLPRLGVRLESLSTTPKHLEPPELNISTLFESEEEEEDNTRNLLKTPHSLNTESSKRRNSTDATRYHDSQCRSISPSSGLIITRSSSSSATYDILKPSNSIIHPTIRTTGTQQHTPTTEVGIQPLPVVLGIPDGHEMYCQLRLLLETFALLRPDIGYVQGMGYLAAMVLLYIRDDFEAFVCFSNLMIRQSLRAFYTFDLPILESYFRVFDFLLHEKLPEVAMCLEEAQIPCSQFLTDWLYTLFTRCLPFDLVSRIWDLFLVDGDAVLFQMSLTLLNHFQSELITTSNPDHLSFFLSSSSCTGHFPSFHTKTFLENAATFHVSRDRLNRMMKAVISEMSNSPCPSSLFEPLKPTESFFPNRSFTANQGMTDANTSQEGINDFVPSVTLPPTPSPLPETSHSNYMSSPSNDAPISDSANIENDSELLSSGLIENNHLNLINDNNTSKPLSSEESLSLSNNKNGSHSKHFPTKRKVMKLFQTGSKNVYWKQL